MYGLPDAVGYWDATIFRQIKKNLLMSHLALEIFRFFTKLRGELHGLPSMYVVDILHAGKPEFLELTRQTERKVKSKPHELDSV